MKKATGKRKAKQDADEKPVSKKKKTAPKTKGGKGNAVKAKAAKKKAPAARK